MISASLPIDAQLLDRLTRLAKQGPSGPNLLTAEQAQQAGEYDWACPHRLTQSARERLHAVARLMAQRLAGDLKPLLRREVALSAQAPAEDYGWRLRATLGASGGFAVPLSPGDGPACGLVVLSARQAAAMVGAMLGVGQSSDGRKLSPLESALLSDVMGTLGRNVAAAAGQLGLSLQAGQTMMEVGEALGPQGAQEYCRLGFCIGEQSEADLHLVVQSELLEGVLRERHGGAAEELSAEQARQRMLDHLGRTRVRIDAVAGTASARFAEVLALESGDVLMLDRRPGDAVELRVGSQAVLRAQAVIVGDQYGLKILP